MTLFTGQHQHIFNRLFGTLLLFVGLQYHCLAQNQNNTGMDFWLGYGAHAAMFNSDGTVNNATGGTQDMRLYIFAYAKANVTVSMPATGWSTTLVLNGGVNTQVVLPKTGANDARLTGEGVFNSGIHISSDQPISAFAHLYDPSGSAETLLIPQELLEQEYYALGFSQAAQENNSFSYCFVVATADSTTVQVIPSADTRNHPANVPFTQLLQKGQVLNLIGKTTGSAGGITNGNDLTGTVIRTLGAGNDTLCKKIAVFTGSSNTLVSCGQGGTGDNLFQQVLPTRTWGKMFITVPTIGMEMNYFRVLTGSDTTKVTVNGAPLTGMVNGMYYQFQTNVPSVVSATGPVVVAQYISSAGKCGNTGLGNKGDPDMVFLTPVGFSIKSASITNPTLSNITSNYINVVIKSVAVDSFKIDTSHQSKYFKRLPYDTSWSYAQIPITPTLHTLFTDSLAFTAIAYGYGTEESYAFNAGFNITSLSILTLQNPYLNPASSICKTIPFKISFYIKVKPVQLIFNFNNNPYLSPNNTIDTLNPVPDSAYVSGGDTTLWRYTLPPSYVYSINGPSTFPLNITEYIPTPEGCIEIRTITYIINVTAKPVAGISAAYDSCSLQSIQFRDSSTVAGGRFINWLWNFGDSTKITRNSKPLKQYAAYGNYTVTLRSITGLGCFADTFKTISLNPKPIVHFGYYGTYCPLDSIYFTDSSSIMAPWTIAQRTWDFGDGTTSAGTNPVKAYNAGGNYFVKLTEVTNKNCSDTAIEPITIYGADTFQHFITVKNAYAGKDTPVVCAAEPFSLSATFTKRQSQIHWDFLGNTNLSPNGNADLLAPVPDSLYYSGADSLFRYSLPGSYTYASAGLLNIKLTTFTPTKEGCLAPTFFNDSVQVINKPVANWSLSYDSCTNDTLYFKDLSTAPGSNIVLWNWSFGDNTFSSDTNPVKKFGAYGDYITTLHIVTGIGCYADTAKPVSLNPKPVAGFTISAATFCPDAPMAFADSSTIATPGKIAQWLWNLGDGSSATGQSTSTQYGTAGTYNVSLIVNSDHNCADTVTKTVTIYTVPQVTISPDVLYITLGVPYELTPAYSGTGLAYIWSPDYDLSSDTAAYPFTSTDKDITYTVIATGDGGCQATATVKINVQKPLVVPNAFSPNNDGINDKWMIGNIEYFPACTVQVFNRYGQPVFSSTGYGTPWDGTLNGNPLPMGTYYYIIDTKVKQFPGTAGWVEIVR